jgi:hypothetical protein
LHRWRTSPSAPMIRTACPSSLPSGS